MKMRYMEKMGQQQKEFARKKYLLRKNGLKVYFGDPHRSVSQMFYIKTCVETIDFFPWDESSLRRLYAGFLIGKRFVVVRIEHPALFYGKLHTRSRAEEIPDPFRIRPSIHRRRTKRDTHIHLVAPISKTQEDFTLQIKNLTKCLLSGEIILSEYFSGYIYDEKKYLEDQAKWGEIEKKWMSEFLTRNAMKVRHIENPDDLKN